MSVQVPTTGWYLENRVGSHKKFYTVLIAENGVVVTAWGRIGTQGQSKIQKFPEFKDAEALGKRQVYSKQTGGYSALAEDFKLTIDSDVLNAACQNESPAILTRLFHEARNNPQFAGDTEVVLKHYEDFVKKAQRLLDTAGDRNFEEVFNEFDELKTTWKTISDKHDEVAVTVNLAEQLLSQRLMSGAL